MTCHPAIPLSVFGWLCFSIGLRRRNRCRHPRPRSCWRNFKAMTRSKFHRRGGSDTSALRPGSIADSDAAAQRRSIPRNSGGGREGNGRNRDYRSLVIGASARAMWSEASKSEDDAVRLEAGRTVGRLQLAGGAPRYSRCCAAIAPPSAGRRPMRPMGWDHTPGRLFPR